MKKGTILLLSGAAVLAYYSLRSISFMMYPQAIVSTSLGRKHQCVPSVLDSSLFMPFPVFLVLLSPTGCATSLYKKSVEDREA